LRIGAAKIRVHFEKKRAKNQFFQVIKIFFIKNSQFSEISSVLKVNFLQCSGMASDDIKKEEQDNLPALAIHFYFDYSV